MTHVKSPVPAQRQAPEPALTARSFQRTVDRALIHRAALGEVFLTDLVQRTDTEFLAAGQLPRSHAYYGDQAHPVSSHDPVLVLEAARQATLAIAHRYFGVPADHKFILTHLDVRIDEPRALQIGERPAELVSAVTVTRERVRDGRTTGLDYHLELSEVGAGPIGTADIGLRFRSPADYLDLRSRGHGGAPLPTSAGHRPEPTAVPVQPGAIARRDPRNVVITEPTVVDDVVIADLVLPTTHPSMFDHPQDHVPGMVLVEAARQIALVAATHHHGYAPQRVQLTGITSEFVKFAELGPTTRLTARTATSPAIGTHTVYTQAGRLEVERDPEPPILVELFQEGEPVARVAVSLTLAERGARAA